MSAFVNALVAVLRELGPVITAATPVLLLLVGWWINKQTRKTADTQTRDLKQHGDVNRKEIQEAVTSASGTYKTPPPPKPDAA